MAAPKHGLPPDAGILHATPGEIEKSSIDGVAKSPIYCVLAGCEMLSVPHVRLRFRNTTTPWISNFLLSHPETFCEIVSIDGVAKNLF
jgi:hypothetical protein